MTSPNGGETFAVGGDHTITWITNYGGDVRIELWKNGVSCEVLVESTPNDGSFDWNEISTEGGADYSIKLSILDSPSTDESDSDFAVIDGIELTGATGGEFFEAGNSYEITWQSVYSGNVKIELYKGAIEESDIAESTSNDGFDEWTIPVEQTPRTDCRVRITTLTEPKRLIRAAVISGSKK